MVYLFITIYALLVASFIYATIRTVADLLAKGR